jgi:peptidoglycan hydrolase-like protein with peptidoglycan-binding domain
MTDQEVHMHYYRMRGAAALLVALAATSPAVAQGRRTLPTGTVILVTTRQALESQTVRTGQTFDTDVVDTVAVDGFEVVPPGSRIRGVVTFAQAATRDRSGVIEVTFDRLTLRDGTVYPMSGKLTSTDSAERRQIDADASRRVVLYGGRGGIGAAIAGASSSRSPASQILNALSGVLSEGRDVSLAAGTRLAVQLREPLSLRVRGIARALEGSSVITASDRIRAAQRELARLNYYRGTETGRLDASTQRALVEYQIDKGMVATGNLDWRTARSLGVLTSGVAGGDVALKTAFTPVEAVAMRRAAQAVAARERSDLGIMGSGQMSSSRTYSTTDVDLWFALSAFADNAVLYEQTVANSGNTEGLTAAGRALINAARRVDSAMSQAGPSSQVRSAWTTIRQQLGAIASDYR